MPVTQLSEWRALRPPDDVRIISTAAPAPNTNLSAQSGLSIKKGAPEPLRRFAARCFQFAFARYVYKRREMIRELKTRDRDD